MTGRYRSLLLFDVGLLGSVLLWYRDVQASKRQEAAEEADPDKPIEGAAEDILNRSAVVGSIVRAVVSDFVPVLAVTGAYGDGKTSVLNLLAKQLELRDDVVFVRFSTWLSMDDKRWCRQLLSPSFAIRESFPKKHAPNFR